VEIRDSLTDGYVGLHYLTETATITMSSRTAGAHVWYKIDRSGNAGLQDAIIPSGNSPVKSVPDPNYDPTGSDLGNPVPTTAKYSGDTGGEDNDYHGLPGQCYTPGYCTACPATGTCPGTATVLASRPLEPLCTMPLSGMHTGKVGTYTDGALIESDDRPMSRWECEVDMLGSCADGTSLTKTTCEGTGNTWNPTPNFKKIKSDMQCNVNHIDIGTYNTVGECAEACAKIQECSLFIYGKINANGNKAGMCFHEETDDPLCREKGYLPTRVNGQNSRVAIPGANGGQAFIADAFDFYTTLGATWDPPPQKTPPGPFDFGAHILFTGLIMLFYSI
jgi:hypothetical protein